MKKILSFILVSIFVMACSNQQSQPKNTPSIDSSVDSSVSLIVDPLKALNTKQKIKK
jgi:hypothetical protein